MASEDAHRQAHAGAGIAEVDDMLRLKQAAEADPVDGIAAVLELGDGCADSTHGVSRGQHVFRFKQTLHGGTADGKRAEHQGSV